MKALTIIAHGSRSKIANDEFLSLAHAVQSTLLNYDLYDACFLEMASPSLAESCEQLIARGATSIDVYPLFFNQGKHVTQDLPALCRQVQQSHSKIKVLQLDYFGSNPEIKNTIIQHIASH